MPRLEDFLRYLDRPGATELVLQTGTEITVRRAGVLEPVTRQPVSLAQMDALVAGTPVAAIVPSHDVASEGHDVVMNGRRYEAICSRFAERLQIRIVAATGAAAAPKPRPEASERHDGRLDRSEPRETPRAQPAPLRGGGREIDLDRTARARDPRQDPPSIVPTVREERAPARAVEERPQPPPAVVARAEPREGPARHTGTSKALGALLTQARQAGASDVHVVAERPASIRRVGQLVPHGEPISDAQVRDMVLPLLGEDERSRLESAGYVDLAVELEGAGRMRVNVCRQRTGLKACFRMVPPEPPTLAELGLPEELAKVTSLHQGLVVLSGPTGQGKSTTMAALVDAFNRTKAAHILTVEDPVEVVHPVKRAVVSQRQVGKHTRSFHSALKAALREDPDIIAIGELRDRETVAMALEAAETGHLVLTTMSTPSAPRSIDRLIDMFPPDDQQQVRATLAGALKYIVGQRLLPSADGTRLVAAAELITGNVALWTLIRDNKLYQLPSLVQRGRAYGMIRIEDSLRELVRRGAISHESARLYADDPRALGDSPDAQPPPASPPGPIRKPSRSGLGNLFRRKGS